MSEFRIKVGVELDASDLESKLKGLDSEYKIPIQLDMDKVSSQLNELKNSFKNTFKLDTSFLNDLKKIFPFAIDGNGKLNRQELARVVFNDQVELKKLNDFSHPLILSELERRIEQED